MSKFLIATGCVLLVAGFLWPYLQNLGIGQLPGDLSFKGKNYSFHVPVMTCLLLSIFLSGLAWIWRKFF